MFAARRISGTWPSPPASPNRPCAPPLQPSLFPQGFFAPSNTPKCAGPSPSINHPRPPRRGQCRPRRRAGSRRAEPMITTTLPGCPACRAPCPRRLRSPCRHSREEPAFRLRAARPDRQSPPLPFRRRAPQSGEIRVAPSGAPVDSVQADLDVANSLYARKMYDYAMAEYEKFLIAHPPRQGARHGAFSAGRMPSHAWATTRRARANYEKLDPGIPRGRVRRLRALIGWVSFLCGGKIRAARLKQFQLAAPEDPQATKFVSPRVAQYRALLRSAQAIRRRPRKPVRPGCRGGEK